MSTKPSSTDRPKIRRIFPNLPYPRAGNFQPDNDSAGRDNAISNEVGARPDRAPRRVSLADAMLVL
ncbi:MAG: hypothetical protein RLZZ347_533 [Candidatus Parcubacteria bacterium]|jgi:hypothetical protein